MKKLLLSLFVSSSFALSAQVSLDFISSYKTGVFDEGAAEIVAYDKINQQVFFTNASASSVGILDFSDVSDISLVKYIDLSQYGSNANSVAVHQNLVAIAIEDTLKQANGKVVFTDLTGKYLNHVEVGALPDNLCFSPNGLILMVACEGEPNDDYTVDPVGSITRIDLSRGVMGLKSNDVKHFYFNHLELSQLDSSVRVFGNNGAASLAEDFEPEYVTISPDNKKAFVALQENNAVAVIDLELDSMVAVYGLGFKNHSLAGNGFDASNKSDLINISTHPVFGIFLPDAIKSFQDNGVNYFVTANEGDSRDYDAYSEEARVKDLNLDPIAFPNAAHLQNDTVLGRLKITTTLGDIDNDGDYDQIYSYGARSFSIYLEDGTQIFDSGDDFEQTIATMYPVYFNSDNADNDSYKDRSDDKGPEPEAIEVIELNGSRLVLIGMERMGGIFIYDITTPSNPTMLGYFLNRNFALPAEDLNAGDLGVEDIVFIPAAESPNGKDLVLTANEVSGTVSVFAFESGLSVQENTLDIGFTVYPNPSKGVDVIKLSKKGNYTLLDLRGSVLANFENTAQIDLSAFQPATYLLVNEFGGVQKIIR